MPQPSTSGKRGRPPGTGKNDNERLLKIAALMAADPGLKPTTAIKKIGETDPSTIRRLRDKFNEQQAQLTAERPALQLAAAATATVMLPTATASFIQCQPAEPVLAAAPLPPSTMPVAIPAAATAPRLAEPEIDFERLFRPAPVQDPFMIFGKWFGNGIQTAAVLFEQQMMFAQSMLKAAPVKAMWRQQIVATEYLLMLSGPGQRISSQTHSTSA
jgi:hypothetical protein